ncbi:MAG TPA: hypothetical protein VHO71_04840 [Caproiciproducens sp.]|nr:hypothetical protein [Caproiciproducens sp.]
MTREKLEEAGEILNEIDALEKLIKCYPSFYVGGTNYSTSDLYQVCSIDDSQTYDVIKQALIDRKSKLKSKFESL